MSPLPFLLSFLSMFSDGREYVYDPILRNYTNATLHCSTYYDGLATIITENDYNNAMNTIPSNTYVFIGLNDIDEEDVWQWVDGSECVYDTGGHHCSNFWSWGQPNNGYNQDCGSIYITNSSSSGFHDGNCAMAFRPSLCNKPTRSYVYDSVKRNWSDAKTYCELYHDGLATIQTLNEYNNAINKIALDTQVWIGMNDLNMEGHWEWSDGSQCIYDAGSHHCSDFWADGEPNNLNGQDCAWIHYNSGIQDGHCYIIKPVLCNELITLNPTNNPTSAPTSKPSNPIHYMSDKSCNNLQDNTQIYYDVSLSECVVYCQQIDENCRMINYFYYFKSHNDSRCYLFYELCDIKTSLFINQSTVVYKVYTLDCIDYPYNWTDNVDDSCIYYETSNWCDNGNILKSTSEFDAFTDSKYGLTAIRTCCECGGGADIVDNVVLSFDDNWDQLEDDILCSWVHSDLTLLLQSKITLRDWDNLILYHLCKHFYEIDCEYLIDTEFQSYNYSYSLFVCNFIINDQSNTTQFLFDIIINDIHQVHNTYINNLWFNIDLLYYSSMLNIYYLNYSQCLDDIHSNQDNDTHKYGVHLCDTIPTFSPTQSPSFEPSMSPSIEPSVLASQLPSNLPTHISSNAPSFHPSIYDPYKTTRSNGNLSVPNTLDNNENLLFVMIGVLGIFFILIIILFGVICFMIKSKNNNNMNDVEMVVNNVKPNGNIEGIPNPINNGNNGINMPATIQMEKNVVNDEKIYDQINQIVPRNIKNVEIDDNFNQELGNDDSTFRM